MTDKGISRKKCYICIGILTMFIYLKYEYSEERNGKYKRELNGSSRDEIY